MFESRNFLCILYPDSTDYDINVVLQNLESFPQYAYCLHDLDVDEDGNGEFQKPHYHCLIRYGSSRESTTVANRLCVAEHYVIKCKDYRQSLKYFLHRTEDSNFKHQYPFSSLKTNIIKASQIVGEVHEGIEVYKMMHYINCGGDFDDLAIECTKSSEKWSVFRRNWKYLEGYFKRRQGVIKNAFPENRTMVNIDKINEYIRLNHINWRENDESV